MVIWGSITRTVDWEDHKDTADETGLIYTIRYSWGRKGRGTSLIVGRRGWDACEEQKMYYYLTQSMY